MAIFFIMGFKYNMKVSFNPVNNTNFCPVTSLKPAFKGMAPVQSLAGKNIGAMKNGVIGQVRVFNVWGERSYLDVVKSADGKGNELYTLENCFGEIVGEMDIKINRAFNYDKRNFPQDPSHVLVEFICNHSNPKTNYFNESVEEYKHIGTRLLQIALKRSEESLCNGSIKLSSVPKAKEFYKKLGFKEIPTKDGLFTGYMDLPPSAREPLSKMYGGL